MEKTEKFYYRVALALPATWRENTFTYVSDEKLTIGSVVSVPFGSNTKIGYIASGDSHSEKNIKHILEDKKYVIPDKTRQFIEWMNTNYPNMPGIHVQHVLPAGMKNWKGAKRTDDKALDVAKPPTLTNKQSKTCEIISSSNSPHVLHGITGSGKTRVYLELIITTLKSGKNVILLYPEISLTHHMEQSLKPYISKDKLHIYHSKGAPSQRKATWLAAASGDTGHVFIGPRSALFLPVNNLGLIIVDEAHDSSYKQDNGSRYNGLYAAAGLAQMWGAKLLFGSATPPVAETHLLEQRSGSMLCMHELALNTIKVSRNFEVIDMTNKSEVSSASHLLSNRLLQAIEESLDNDKQSIIFLNRRGTARSVVCQNCGWHAICTSCNNALTYHHDIHKLQCHICGTTHQSVHSCPDCSSEISLQSPGTKAVLVELQKLFPQARIKRFDSDNKKAESLSENYESLRNGEVDIAIGTQLITKGLDLPKLETVGVLQADSSLYLPDFSSTERTFQLLTQVSGRVGRGHDSGRAILQTFNPDSPLFNLVMKQDWHEFYKKELEDRQAQQFPPYSYMAKIWVLKKSPQAAQKAVERIANSISDPAISILGPAPSFYEKVSGLYSWQILFRSKHRSKLLQAISELPRDAYYDIDPVSLL